MQELLTPANTPGYLSPVFQASTESDLSPQGIPTVDRAVINDTSKDGVRSYNLLVEGTNLAAVMGIEGRQTLIQNLRFPEALLNVMILFVNPRKTSET